VYLLDTNIITYSFYHPENHPYLMHKIRTVKERDQCVSSVTVEELLRGRLAALKPSDRTFPEIWQRYHYFEEALKDVTKLKVLPFDEAAFRAYETIPASVRCGRHDKMIAATALSNNLTLVTANVKDFKDIPNLVIEDWTARPLE
jgi:tRNA(fMet)-specific endonuclease VapC